MRIVAWSRRAKVTLGVFAATFILPAVVAVGVAAPAQAYSCSSWSYVSMSSGVSELDYNFAPRCSDGQSHVYGTVYDTSCDGRQAQGFMQVETVPEIGSPWQVWLKSAAVDNGCGNYTTFTGSGPEPATSSGQTWRVHACTWAQNSSGSSSMACDDINQ
jgi:hypothetical protein